MISGSEAKRGDTVRNLTTQCVGTMTDPMNSGRIVVKCQRHVGNCSEHWERSNTEVLLEGSST